MIPLSFWHAICLSMSFFVLLLYHAICAASCLSLYITICPFILSCCSPLTTIPSLALSFPVLDLCKRSLQRRKQAPRLHGPTQHTKAHQEQPRQSQHDSERNPVCLYRICHAEISRHILGQKGQWEEEDGRFADEKCHPRKAIDTRRLRHGHELEILP